MQNSSDPEDRVGYGKPPKSSQFKKGKSGNYSGRPPKRNSPMELLDVILSRSVAVTNSTGKKTNLSNAEATAEGLILSALDGDVDAIRQVLQYAMKLRDVGHGQVIIVQNALPEDPPDE